MDRVARLLQQIAKARFENDQEMERFLLEDLGDAFFESGDIPGSIESYKQALSITQTAAARQDEVNTLSKLGSVYIASGQPQQAIPLYEQALAIASRSQDLKLAGNILSSLGVAFKDMGETFRAIEFYEQALAVARQIGDHRAEGAILGTLGNTYAAQEQIHHAIEYYEQALVLARQIDDYRAERATFSNLGNAYAALGQVHLAIKYYEQALALADSDRVIGLDPTYAALYRNRGNAYIALEEFQKAIDDYERAIALDPDNAAAYASKGDALAHIGRSVEAVAAYDQAIRLEPDDIVYQAQKQLLLTRFQPEMELEEDNSTTLSQQADLLKTPVMHSRSGQAETAPEENTLSAPEGERQEWRRRRREELLDELKPGEVRHGVVSNLANFGAFIDLGGADGMVHISQLAWSRVNHPGEVLHVGQQVEVQVLSVDKEKKKIALSIKRAERDPWTTVEQRYTPGQVVTGVITKIAPFGAFARIEDGVEGLIHLSELTPGTDPQTFHEGQQLRLRIIRIDAQRRRIGLSLRQADALDSQSIPGETLPEQSGR